MPRVASAINVPLRSRYFFICFPLALPFSLCAFGRVLVALFKKRVFLEKTLTRSSSAQAFLTTTRFARGCQATITENMNKL
jgi:hypothetical protein